MAVSGGLDDEQSSVNQAEILGAVLDLDGTLLDTEPLYDRAFNSVTLTYGKPYEWELKKKVMGTPEIVGAQIIVDSLDLPITPEQLLL